MAKVTLTFDAADDAAVDIANTLKDVASYMGDGVEWTILTNDGDTEVTSTDPLPCICDGLNHYSYCTYSPGNRFKPPTESAHFRSYD